MTNTPQLYRFSQQEFELRKAEARARYIGDIQEPHIPGSQGAIVHQVIDGLQNGVEQYHLLRKAGYTSLPGTSPLQSFRATGSVVELYLVKPEKIQTKELGDIYDTVRSEYENEIEQAYEAELERQVELALAAEERRKERELAMERAAIAAKVHQELTESRAALREKLIAEGKMNTRGEAK